MPANVMILPV